MIKSLYIEDYALIDKMSIEFGEGLNVLTGETGAGKSIIIGAISLIVGEKASAEYVKHTRDRAVIEAIFVLTPEAADYLREQQIETDAQEVVITREVSASGRSTVKANGRPITQNVLKELTTYLIDIHGQHEHQSLLNEHKQIDLLDDFIEFDKNKLAELFTLYQQAGKDLKNKQQKYLEQQEQEDYYRHLYNELETARLDSGEYDRLKALKAEISNYSDQGEKLQNAIAELARGVENISRANSILFKIKSSGTLKEIIDSAEPAVSAINSIQEDLSEYYENLDYSPQRLSEVVARLDLLNSLKIKHLKGTLPDKDIADALLDRQQEIAEILEGITYAEDQIKQLEQVKNDLYQQYCAAAAKLSIERKEKAEQISTNIEHSLKELNMKNTRFQIVLEKAADSVNGQDEVRFLISPNPGQPLRSLSRIASGGELSRVMLAIKSVLIKKDRIPTMIFDEIDTGIGGVTAVAIASKMKQIANDHQILVVTHLPQIAREAATHLRVSKQVVGQETQVDVSSLSDQEKVSELARMLGGESEGSLAHAQEMLKG